MAGSWYICYISANGRFDDAAANKLLLIVWIDVINQTWIRNSVRVDVPTSIVKWYVDK